MTGTKWKPVKFATFFDCFYKYWDYTSKIGTEYNQLEVTFQNGDTFENGVRWAEVDLLCLGQ